MAEQGGVASGRGKICLSLAGEDAAALIRMAEPLVHLADLVEIRLDSMRQPDIAPFVARFALPILVTNRPQWEGGAFSGTEEERLHQLNKAMRAGAAYVDIELRTEDALRNALLAEAHTQGVWPLVSWHDFNTTPDAADLQAIFHAMRKSGARSGKIVTTAASSQDALRLLNVLEAAQAATFPLSVFAMGTPGRITRLATLYLGGHISYAAAGTVEATAPGQLSISQLHALCALFEETA